MLTIPSKSHNPDVLASYQLLAGQTHVARVLQWLKDRQQVFQQLKIKNLHVTLGPGGHHIGMYTITMELAR